MPKSTKTIRLSVVRFETDDWKTLAKDLYGARRDLRRAANEIMSRLYAERRRLSKEEKPQADRSYCYQLMTGRRKVGDTWEPHECVYEPKIRAVSGGVKAALATKVYDRYSTDLREILRGEKSVPSFKDGMAIPVRQQEVRIVEPDLVRLSLWGQTVQEGGKKQNPKPVLARIRPRGDGHSAIWRRIRSGEYKYGSAELTTDRRNRWFLNVTYSFDAKPETEVTEDRILGIDLGMTDMVSAAVYDSKSEKFGKYRTFSPPADFWRLFRRNLDLRRQVGRSNRSEYGLRAGRGRARKLRPLSQIRERYRRRVDGVILKVAKATVDFAVRSGCGVVALENLGWSTQKLHDDAEMLDTRRSRAAFRNRFLRWNQGALRSAVKAKCVERGLKCIEVDAAYTSQTCSACGAQELWDRDEESKTKSRRSDSPCRRDGKVFTCQCGTWTKKGRCDADLNAARNIAKRGNDE